MNFTIINTFIYLVLKNILKYLSSTSFGFFLIIDRYVVQTRALLLLPLISTLSSIILLQV